MEEQSLIFQKKRIKDIDKRAFMLSVLNPSRLNIGRWKFEPINEMNELVVKIYFIRKQICYEILLNNGSKHKVEIQWSHIMGIRASLYNNEPGILELELTQPPKLYEKIKNVDPRDHDKHKWVDAGLDFTQGQAPISRRHLVMFPPGMLDKHFEKLISFDERLFELSQKPYPTIENVVYFQQQHQQPQPNFLQNHDFPMNNNNHQILQIPHANAGHHHHLTFQIPQILSDFGLSSNSMMSDPALGTVTMNNHSTNPQECSDWRVLPQVPNSNGYLPNDYDDDNIGDGSIISNTNMPIRMYGETMMSNNNNINPNPLLDQEAINYGYFSNWPTDQYGVWLPPPQQHIAKQFMAPQF